MVKRLNSDVKSADISLFGEYFSGGGVVDSSWMTQPSDAEENPPRSQYKTKADVVDFVKKSFSDGATAIETRGDKGMSEIVVDPYSNDQTRISDYAYGYIEHSGEHYGQLVVYYRLNGIVPPESRPRK